MLNQHEEKVEIRLDLSLFEKLSPRSGYSRRPKCRVLGSRFKEARLNKSLAEAVKFDWVEIYLNKAGTIMVFKESAEGEGFRIYRCRGNADKGARIAVASLVNRLKELGISLPADYFFSFDENLGAWVGRLKRECVPRSERKVTPLGLGGR